MNLQRILTTVVLIVVALSTTGCAHARAQSESRATQSSPLSVLESSNGEHLMSGCADSEWPEDCEVRTIQVQRAVGLYFIPPDADVEAEMQRMDASFVENGALFESLVEP